MIFGVGNDLFKKKQHFMKIFWYFILIISLWSCSPQKTTENELPKRKVTLVIHGGAGNITKENLSEERWVLYKKGLQNALNKGYEVLENGGLAIDAVETAIIEMENNPLFNAGKGAVYNTYGQQEMDASIMDGSNLNCGAVAGVNGIKNPIAAAKRVMTQSKHVMFSGNGAKLFAQKQGLEIVDSSYFYSKRRYDYWKSVKEKEQLELDHNQLSFENDPNYWEHKKYGTVGAVALDKNGNIAAGTSTGGLTNKKYGRIGDSPIIGAGTYANNKTCGVSSTGTGEFFIRTNAAFHVSSLVDYKGISIQQASDDVIHNHIGKLGGDGGMIVLDTLGHVAYSFNTSGMFRGYKNSDGEVKIEAFKN